MTPMNGIRSGVIEIAEDTDLRGMVSGVVTVAPGCRVRISGMASGTIILGEGAELETPGMFSGTIVRR